MVLVSDRKWRSTYRGPRRAAGNFAAGAIAGTGVWPATFVAQPTRREVDTGWQDFFERARALVESFDELAADIKAVGSDSEQRVRIGVPPTCAADQGVDLWTTISACRPNRRVEIIVGLSRFLAELLRRGDVDMALSLHRSTDLDIEHSLVER